MGMMMFRYPGFSGREEVQLLRALDGLRMQYGIAFEVNFALKLVTITGNNRILQHIADTLNQHCGNQVNINHTNDPEQIKAAIKAMFEEGK